MSTLADDDSRRALVYDKFATHLIRPPGTLPDGTDEVDLHVWAIATSGVGGWLKGLMQSEEAKVILRLKNSTLGLNPGRVP